MNRRERLTATLQGKPVDRPAVCFYEINGLDENPSNPDRFNIYSHPSWLPLIELAREKSDRIVMRGVAFKEIAPDPIGHVAKDETWDDSEGRRHTRRTIAAGKRTLTMQTRQDPDINTVWTTEHLLKNVDDLDAFLELPPFGAGEIVDATEFLRTEAALGDTGIALIDTPDPLCLAALLFELGEYTVIAMTEPERFRRLLDRFAEVLLAKTAEVANVLPGRLWRIYGPEFAAAPYLPPRLFREYVSRYVTPMIEIVHRSGGYVRVHSHGRLKGILDDIVATGADAIDPIEPPPQGDVELAYVRQRYGKQLALFGNLEIADIENLPTPQFAEKVKRAVDEGTAGEGRGFVLMASASPYGRVLSALALKNYETMVQIVGA
jgi:uroporphyrinogen-III decarboxylase